MAYWPPFGMFGLSFHVSASGATLVISMASCASATPANAIPSNRLYRDEKAPMPDASGAVRTAIRAGKSRRTGREPGYGGAVPLKRLLLYAASTHGDRHPCQPGIVRPFPTPGFGECADCALGSGLRRLCISRCAAIGRALANFRDTGLERDFRPALSPKTTITSLK
jgi:hypothetical protein